MKQVKKIVPLLFLGVLLAACGGGDDGDTAGPATAGGSAAPETTTLSVGHVPNNDAAPLMFAVERGYFKEEGLTVTPRSVAGGAAGIPAILAGEDQISLGNLFSLLQAREGGAPLVALDPMFTIAPDTTTIMAGPSSRYKTVEQLKGQKVTLAINTLGNIGELMTRSAWESAGLDWSNVKPVQIPFPEMAAALERRDVDLAWLVDPFGTPAKAKGFVTVLDTAFTKAPMEDGMPTGIPVATEDFVKKNPETVKRFIRAMRKAGDELNSNRAALNKTVAAYSGQPAASLEQFKFGTYAPDVNRKALEELARLALEFKIVKKKHPLDDWFVEVDTA
jgi:NitT/TauT family transport system substrate-binding protein